MRVLYLLNTTVMGGGNISFINMIKGMKEKGVEIYIVHPDKNPDQSFLESVKDVVQNIFYVPMQARTTKRSENGKGSLKGWLKRTYIWYRYRLQNEIELLKQVVIEVSPDIIHTNVGVLHSGYYVARSLGIPHVWHLREYQTKDFNWEILPSKSFFISLLKRSYVISITKDIRSYFGLDSYKKAACIYNGCFSEKDIALVFPKKKYFLCCSRVSVEKGHDEVIRAFAEFVRKHDDFRLVIAGFGDSKYIAELKELAISLNCFDYIDFIGYQSDIRPLMDNAMGLVVASRFEGFGRMTAEAAFRGCIVIGRNTGGTKEILELTGGYLYDGSSEALLDQMCALACLTEQEYREHALPAQLIAMREFSTERSNERIYSFYQSVLRSKKDHIE